MTDEAWYIGALNDGKFIINKPPRPTLDDHWHDRPDGPTLVLNVVKLTDAQADAVVDAHNEAITRTREAERALAAEARIALKVADELFVYGDNESTKVCQDKLFRMEAAEAKLARLTNPDEAMVFAAERALRDRWTKPARERVLGVARALAATLDKEE